MMICVITIVEKSNFKGGILLILLIKVSLSAALVKVWENDRQGQQIYTINPVVQTGLVEYEKYVYLLVALWEM